jgi:hypothetical protein
VASFSIILSCWGHVKRGGKQCSRWEPSDYLYGGLCCRDPSVQGVGSGGGGPCDMSHAQRDPACGSMVRMANQAWHLYHEAIVERFQTEVGRDGVCAGQGQGRCGDTEAHRLAY